jgi:aryl-alcohol dehydrogenase-like predicted oxidoreductase
MRYKLLGRSGLRVSELALGTMTFGEDWGWGASKDESCRIFTAFAEAGGNFIDTSNNYTDGTSETYVGEFIRPEREYFVVGTKYTLNTRKDDPNAGGNHRKNLVQAVEASLRRLGTDYVDLLWLHMWDFTTPVEEVLRSLDDLVRGGKVLYLGISDTPAWVVAQANTMADLRGWSRFIALQASYSLADRAAERDLIPVAEAFDMAFTPWGVLEGGELTGKYNQETTEPKRSSQASSTALALAGELLKLAEEIGRPPAQIAINWVRQRAMRTPMIPILGARTEAQVRSNLASLEFELATEQLQTLEAANRLRTGFPHDFLASDHVHNLIFGDMYNSIDNHRR